MAHVSDIATAAAFYGGALLAFCACGALAERYLLREQASRRRVRDNLRRAGLL